MLPIVASIKLCFILAIIVQSQDANKQYDGKTLETDDATCFLQVRTQVKLHKNQASVSVAKAQKVANKLGKVVYINRDNDTDRKAFMEAQGRNLSMNFERFPAIELTHTDNGDFIQEDLPKLKKAFARWACDLKVCFAGTMNTTIHGTAGGSNPKAHLNKVANFSPLGNLASHLIVFQQLEHDYANGLRNWTIVAEDDCRFLSSDWVERLMHVASLTDEWDIIKLYSTGHDGNHQSAAFHSHMCDSSLCMNGQCMRCMRTINWGTTALLVNPSKATKILRAIELAFQKQKMSYKRFSIDYMLAVAAEWGFINAFVTTPVLAKPDALLNKESTMSLE